ncbi:uncharacterized protein [Aegilops tauschii subsp. strangulata]|uniref:uncharacterized protein n=1 Tax=Aegilops tauschii subsp. strangulata TaxID=200361 RepID=UPI00098B8B6C|nr:uncharacterized protein LOC109747687 [Aegilops tauschii subsp. strangulata]XP_044418232.1 uncharacterized protein LOC123143382 [Triticum aestivum]
MWGYLRALFCKMRKHVHMGKRKLLLGAHLLVRRRNKSLSRSVANFLSHHHGHHRGRREYEFSCSGSLDLGSFSMHCRVPASSSPGALMMREELAIGEECKSAGMPPLVPGAVDGGFSVRVSNFPSDEVDGDQLGLGEAVDDEAEEFIARFYAQLRR